MNRVYLWSAWATMTKAQVIGLMQEPSSTPIDPTGTNDGTHWTIAVNCSLKPGQALSMVSLFPTVFP